VENPRTGQWDVFEVTSESVASLAASTGVAREELLQSTTNEKRVDSEIEVFARHSDVSVDPQYGKWKGLTVIPPVGPPAQYLLPAVSGDAITSLTPTGLRPAGGSGTTATTAPSTTGG
jgi:hypothetical protein